MVKTMSDVIPPANTARRAASVSPRQSGVDTNKTPEQVINEAPLASAAGKPETTVATAERKAWRINTTMSEDELMVLTEKSSFNIPMELILRLDFLVSQSKARGLGRKTNKTALVIEALDEYTTRELKKLGQKV